MTKINKTAGKEYPSDTGTVYILGGGLAGLFAARELSRHNWTDPTTGEHRKLKVIILEADVDVLGPKSSSRNECRKLHLGMHYAADKPTAIKCLKSAIGFAREFPECILGETGDEPWRRGWHLLMKESSVSVSEFKAVKASLEKRYQELIDEDPENAVFGLPGSFHRELSKEEIHPLVAEHISMPDPKRSSQRPDEVVYGLETRESQIDIEALKKRLLSELKKNGVEIYVNHRVESASFRADPDSGYDLKVARPDGGGGEEYVVIHAPMVVNCTWQNSELVCRDLGFSAPETMDCRLKASIVVMLPEELLQTHTMICSIGPYYSFTNLGDGTAIITYEPYTNVGHYDAYGKPDEKLAAYLDPKKGPKLKEQLGREILVGAAKFLPGLHGAAIKAVNYGYVKVPVKPRAATRPDDASVSRYHPVAMRSPSRTGRSQRCDIYDAHSNLHARQSDGVAEEGPGWYRFNGMKMVYAMQAAQRLWRVVSGRLETSSVPHIEACRGIAKRTAETSEGGITTMLFSVVYAVLRRLTPFNLGKEVKPRIELPAVVEDGIPVVKRISSVNIQEEIEAAVTRLGQGLASALQECRQDLARLRSLLSISSAGKLEGYETYVQFLRTAERDYEYSLQEKYVRNKDSQVAALKQFMLAREQKDLDAAEAYVVKGHSGHSTVSAETFLKTGRQRRYTKYKNELHEYELRLEVFRAIMVQLKDPERSNKSELYDSGCVEKLLGEEFQPHKTGNEFVVCKDAAAWYRALLQQASRTIMDKVKLYNSVKSTLSAHITDVELEVEYVKRCLASHDVGGASVGTVLRPLDLNGRKLRRPIASWIFDDFCRKNRNIILKEAARIATSRAEEGEQASLAIWRRPSITGGGSDV